jgi:rRNA maturation protein Nop10
MGPQTQDQPAAAETTNETKCPDCGAVIGQTGFIVSTVHHQAFTPSANGFVKSHKVKSYTIEARCPLCGATLDESAEALIGKKL